uniref:CD99 antigen n=1 Tax=Myxine glutinosa TaxID=7769 RepID=UPI00358E14BA
MKIITIMKSSSLVSFAIVALLALSVTGAPVDDDFSDSDLFDLDDPKPTISKPPVKEKDGFDDSDLLDGFGDDDPIPKKTPKPVKPNAPPASDIGDDDLAGIGGPGKPGSRGRGVAPPASDVEGDDNPQATPGTVAGILAALIGALFAGASSFIAYQKKKLCFKQHDNQEGGGAQQPGDEPQMFSSLLQNAGRFFNFNSQQQQPAAQQYAEPPGKADKPAETPGEFELPDEHKV